MVDTLTFKLDELEELFLQYIRATNLLSNSDLEDIDKNNLIIECRQKLIDQMETINGQILEIIGKFNEHEQELIRGMLKGENIFGSLSNDEDLIYSKILNIKSLQGEIVQKDKINNSRFLSKYNEIKTALSELKNDKKKIDFYNNTKISSGKGIEFSQNI